MTMDFIGCDNYNLFVLMRKKTKIKMERKKQIKLLKNILNAEYD